MKKLLLPLLLINSSIFAQEFDGTIVDLDSGRIQVIDGGFTESAWTPYKRSTISYDQMCAEIAASTRALRQEFMAQRQLSELREQTELLRQIANQQ